MGQELTGKYVSSTYLNLVQHSSDNNYYDGAGNLLSINDASAKYYATNSSVNLAFYSNASLGLVSNEYTTNASISFALTSNVSLGLAFDQYSNVSLGLAFDQYSNVSLGLANISYAINSSVNLAFYSNASLGLAVDVPATLSSDASLGLAFNQYTCVSLGLYIEKTSIGVVIDGDNSVILTGSKGYREINGNYAFTNWLLLSDISGNLVIDVKCGNYETWPVTTSIAGSEKPTLTAENKNKDTDLTTWQVNVSTGDIIEFNVDSAEDVTKAWLFLNLIKR